jgi:hypothetical protein
MSQASPRPLIPSKGQVLLLELYLNNLIEQDHRAIKHRSAAMVGGFKSLSGVRPLPWPVSSLPIGYVRETILVRARSKS